MKLAGLIARILLGLVFAVFGLNGFLQFLPAGPLPSEVASRFIGALMQSHYLFVVSTLQVAGGVLLLTNRYVPLSLTILGPVIVNIFLFHMLMAPSGLPIAVAVVALWGILMFRHRQYFASLF